MNRRSRHALVVLASVVMSLIFLVSCGSGEAPGVNATLAAGLSCNATTDSTDADEETTRLAALLEKYSVSAVGSPTTTVVDGTRSITQNLDARPLDGSSAALAVAVTCNANCNIAIGCQPNGCEPSGKTCTSLTCKQTGSHGCEAPVCTRSLTAATAVPAQPVR